MLTYTSSLPNTQYTHISTPACHPICPQFVVSQVKADMDAADARARANTASVALASLQAE